MQQLSDTAQPDTITPDTANPYLDKPDADKPRTESAAQLNTYRSKNNLPGTKKSDTHTENPYQSNPSLFYQSASCSKKAGVDGVGYDNPEQLSKTIMENIDYDCIADKYNRDQMDEIVELMLEVLCRKSQNIRMTSVTTVPVCCLQTVLRSSRFRSGWDTVTFRPRQIFMHIWTTAPSCPQQRRW